MAPSVDMPVDINVFSIPHNRMKELVDEYNMMVNIILNLLNFLNLQIKI